MAVYLGSQQVGFNTTYGGFACWYGFSESIANKMTSSSTNVRISAIIEAPAGCSIYAYKTMISFSTAQYSTSASVRYSRYYLIANGVRSTLAEINTQNLIYPQSYLTSVVASLSHNSTSSMYFAGANAIAYGITDTIIKDSTLIYSRSSVIESFFPGIINSFIKVDASKLASIPSEAFKNRRTLISVNIPNCTTIGNSAFYYCQSLTSANFPECTTIGSYGFYHCFGLTSVSFPSCINIYSSAFASCYNLTLLNLIGVSAVPNLSTNVFVSTPIGGYSTSAGQYGSVYVPASLYNDFIVAENWSDISSCIVSV